MHRDSQKKPCTSIATGHIVQEGQPLSYTPPDFYAGNPAEDEAIAACHIAFAVVMLWKAD